MFTTFMASFFIFTTTKDTFSKISYSLSGKIFFMPLLFIYIKNHYLNKIIIIIIIKKKGNNKKIIKKVMLSNYTFSNSNFL